MPISKHQPVLLKETLELLNLKEGLTVVDGTLGGGGHSQHILDRIGTTGQLIGLDRDPMMIELAGERLKQSNFQSHCDSYVHLQKILTEQQMFHVDRILVDLGLSSDQLADEERGFSFQSTGQLDLRFNPTQGAPAWELLNQSEEEELEQIFSEYGEEKHSLVIAKTIVQKRKSRLIQTVTDLVEIIQEAVPYQLKRNTRKHPATRVFQALRIAVNEELEHLKNSLDHTFPDCLKPGGRLVVISFHSLEDRLIKNCFRGSELWQNLTPKPLTPTPSEQRNNPRSRSAKLRGAKLRSSQAFHPK